jgi:hypothetical protein
LFIIDSLSYNITYLPWLITSYSCTPFMVLVWSYHWRFRYPFALMPMWEWMYNNSIHTLGYYCNNYFKEWNTCSEGGLPPFPSPHSTMNEYFYYQRWLLYFDGHCHCWLALHRYGAMNIDDNDNKCNDNGCLGEDTILH